MNWVGVWCQHFGLNDLFKLRFRFYIYGRGNPFIPNRGEPIEWQFLCKCRFAVSDITKSDCLVFLSVFSPWLNINMDWNEGGSLFWQYSNMNIKILYTYRSFSFKISDFLHRGSVWVLYLTLFIVRNIRFCKMFVLFRVDKDAFPHASIP